MNGPIDILDVVALLHDLPEKGLVTGQVGTVVELLDDGVYEVEFSDDGGKTYAMLPLRVDELMVLRYSPFEVA
jgi:hypothetical protein